MAEKPIQTPLPADLPENWNTGQIVAPDGTTVGLTEQHGYNYLMKMVNRAQEGVNAVNEAFETVSGKRTCRFVVGTSTAGWTEADCDYLCGGTDDQVEIQAAIDALPEAGGEIVLLDGTYALSAKVLDQISISGKSNFVAIKGSSGSTVLSGGRLRVGGSNLSLEGITLRGTDVNADNSSLYVRNCIFLDGVINGQNSTEATNASILIDGCEFHNKTSAAVSIFSTESKTQCVISNNIFETEYASGMTLVNLSYVNQCIFSGNSIKCMGAPAYIAWNSAGIVTGNTFDNCEIKASPKSTAIAGNRLISCHLDVSLDQHPESCATVSGNAFEDGTVSASGNVSVTGNSFVINESSGTVNAIRIYRSGTAGDDDRSPAVVGNCITGGTVGILLEDPPASWKVHTANVLVSDNRIFGPATPIKIGKYWQDCMVTDNLFATGAVEDSGTGNIVRFNSDDASTGGGSGGTAGVTTFNGRSGRVTPASGDYTAAMTGAIPAADVKAIQPITQSAYDALAAKSPTTLYLIEE